jgi:hypothetical protein
MIKSKVIKKKNILQISFDDAINYWYGEIKNSCPPNTPLLLVGKNYFIP